MNGLKYCGIITSLHFLRSQKIEAGLKEDREDVGAADSEQDILPVSRNLPGKLHHAKANGKPLHL